MMKPLVNMTFNQLIEQTATRFPNHKAIISGGKSWTYNQLNGITDSIAAGLLASGITKGDHIGILSENTPQAVFALLGIAKAGAVACMINTSLKTNEIVDLLQLSEVDYLMIGSRYKETAFYDISLAIMEEYPLKKVFSLPSDRFCPYINLNDLIILGEIHKGLYFEQKNKINASDDGLILYTSGTTGKTVKAVVSSYFHMTNAGIQKADSLQMTSDDKVCCALQLFHIFCLDVNIFAAMATGACLVMPEDMHSTTILDAIADHECTILSSVPSIYLSLVMKDKVNHHNLSSLRAGIIGGAYCSEETFCKINDYFGFTLLPGLGQTEAAAGIAVAELSDSLKIRSTTVGHFVNHNEGKIIDSASGKVLSNGQMGEICVKSPMLMTGYYKRPDLTSEIIDADGWLHTGDLGMLDENGYLHFMGRQKELINRGGEKILPSEVENAIYTLPEICTCKVIGLPDSHYGEEVYACVMLKKGLQIAENTILSHLKPILADYKIPKKIVFISSFPLNAAGKIKLPALKEQALKKLEVG